MSVCQRYVRDMFRIVSIFLFIYVPRHLQRANGMLVVEDDEASITNLLDITRPVHKPHGKRGGVANVQHPGHHPGMHQYPGQAPSAHTGSQPYGQAAGTYAGSQPYGQGSAMYHSPGQAPLAHPGSQPYGQPYGQATGTYAGSQPYGQGPGMHQHPGQAPSAHLGSQPYGQATGTYAGSQPYGQGPAKYHSPGQAPLAHAGSQLHGQGPGMHGGVHPLGQAPGQGGVGMPSGTPEHGCWQLNAITYRDPLKKEDFFIKQTGCQVEFNKGGKSKKGTLTGTGGNILMVKGFRNNGEVQPDGSVKFNDGGMWIKLNGDAKPPSLPAMAPSFHGSGGANLPGGSGMPPYHGSGGTHPSSRSGMPPTFPGNGGGMPQQYPGSVGASRSGMPPPFPGNNGAGSPSGAGMTQPYHGSGGANFPGRSGMPSGSMSSSGSVPSRTGVAPSFAGSGGTSYSSFGTSRPSASNSNSNGKNNGLFIVEKGYCREEDRWGGWCECGKAATQKECYEIALQWEHVKAVEFSKEGCNPMTFSSDEPTDCPDGCTAVEGAGDPDPESLHGDERDGCECLVLTNASLAKAGKTGVKPVGKPATGMPGKPTTPGLSGTTPLGQAPTNVGGRMPAGQPKPMPGGQQTPGIQQPGTQSAVPAPREAPRGVAPLGGSAKQTPPEAPAKPSGTPANPSGKPQGQPAPLAPPLGVPATQPLSGTPGKSPGKEAPQGIPPPATADKPVGKLPGQLPSQGSALPGKGGQKQPSGWPAGTKFTAQNGFCRELQKEENHLVKKWGGWCDCGKLANEQKCFEKGLQWKNMKAVEFSSSGCQPMSYSHALPSDCPDNCTAESGADNPDDPDLEKLVGDNSSGWKCLVPNGAKGPQQGNSNAQRIGGGGMGMASGGMSMGPSGTSGRPGPTSPGMAGSMGLGTSGIAGAASALRAGGGMTSGPLGPQAIPGATTPTMASGGMPMAAPQTLSTPGTMPPGQVPGNSGGASPLATATAAIPGKTSSSRSGQKSSQSGNAGKKKAAPPGIPNKKATPQKKPGKPVKKSLSL